jgi:hypothetical protein
MLGMTLENKLPDFWKYLLEMPTMASDPYGY